MDRDAGAKVVVAEAGSAGVLALGEERAAAGDDGDDNRTRSRYRILRTCRRGAGDSDRCDEPCNPTRHD